MSMKDPMGTPEKMTTAEFEELYNRAVTRMGGCEKRAALKSHEITIRELVHEEIARMFGGEANGQKEN